MGILGAGAIGNEVIHRLRPFKVRIVALTQPGGTVAGADLSLGEAQVDTLFTESDHVIVSLPLTAATKGVVGFRQLELLGPEGWVINVGRGPLIDTQALVRALGLQLIGGAGLDVTDPEPLPLSHPLWAMDNVLITSHGANTASMAANAYAKLVTENLARYRRGETLDGVIDLDRQY